MEGSYRFPAGLDLGCSYGSYLISRKSNKRPELLPTSSKPSAVPTLPLVTAATSTTHTLQQDDSHGGLHSIVQSLVQLVSVVNDLQAMLAATGNDHTTNTSSLLSTVRMLPQLTRGRDDKRTMQLIQQCLDFIVISLQETVGYLHFNQLHHNEFKKNPETQGQGIGIDNELKHDRTHSKKQVIDRRRIATLERQITSLNQRINELERKEHTLMKELNEEQTKIKHLKNKLRMTTKHKTASQGWPQSLRETYKDELYELAHFKDEKTASKTVNKLKEFGVI